MLKRVLLVLVAVLVLVILGFPAFSADQPKTVSASAAKPQALTSEQTALHAKLQRLAAPNPSLKLARGAMPVFKPTTVKKEISCGIFMYPPTINPMATSQRLYWVNNTGQAFPVGVHVEFEVQGNPPSCCKGVTGATTSIWPPNPPSPVYFTSMESELVPPQPWTRPCRAWVIIP
ncbi:MAG: hypothetical protein IPL89_18630 [Acidobacteria bacterium]|nr:hypothetical protein [Acidobacteriota bacterium]